MRHFLLYLALSASLAACDGDNSVRITTTSSSDDQGAGVLKVIDALQCPDTLGVLTRKGLAAAGGAKHGAGESHAVATPQAPAGAGAWVERRSRTTGGTFWMNTASGEAVSVRPW